MGKIGTKLPNFCLNRIRPHVRVRSPSIAQSKLDASDATKNAGHKSEDYSISGTGGEEKGGGDGANKPGFSVARKIMIVVDSSFEAKGALQWVLSHSVQSQDKLVLLHVTKPSTSKQASGDEPRKDVIAPRAYELVHSLKNMCQLKRPEVEIEVAVVVEGKEKGPTILEEAKRQEVALLVLGQKKRSTTWRLLMIWAGNRVGGGGGVVEYCIQNASCMAVAVRRKSKKVGGYLITTKRQKDFWLLA